jgi:hypothetical protein
MEIAKNLQKEIIGKKKIITKEIKRTLHRLMKWFEHISCAIRLPKVVVYLFFVVLGKSAEPRLWAPADRLPQ